MKKIYTDGACKKNPGKGGWAYLILDASNNELGDGSGSNPSTTNNRMEMTAVIEGLKRTEAGEVIEIYSDSAYVVNCFRDNWIAGWKKRGWKNSKRQPVENRELWEEMDSLVEERSVEFFKVKAHCKENHPDYDPYNDKVDRIADLVARNA